MPRSGGAGFSPLQRRGYPRCGLSYVRKIAILRNPRHNLRHEINSIPASLAMLVLAASSFAAAVKDREAAVRDDKRTQ
jgi:hypothetical protein